MNIYIFRHGLTYFAKNNIPYGDQIETAEILEEGIPAIKKIGEYLKNIPTDLNFTSPIKRCLQTSGIISEIAGKKFEIDENLRDWNPDKESVENMIERVLSFCNQLKDSNLSTVSICTHGFPINALIAYFTKGNIDKSDLPVYPKPGVLASIIDGKVSYKDFNEE